jgi:hypothetical protein
VKHAASPPPRRWRLRGKPARPGQAGPADPVPTARPVPPAGSIPPAGPEPGRTRRPQLEQLPYWILLAGTALGLLAMRQGAQDARGGTLELAGVLLVAAVARLLLPERRAGMLRSRRRLADVAAFAALGTGLLVVGLLLTVPA